MSFLSAILVAGTEMSHSNWGNASPCDLTCHRRNKLRWPSLVGKVAVAEAAVAVGGVHRKFSLTTVPVSLVLEGSQRWVAYYVAPSPAAVTVFLCLTPTPSEPNAL